MKVQTCPQCGEDRETVGASAGTFCPRCAAERRQAIQRIIGLREPLDRLMAAMACIRRIATIGGREGGWRGASYASDWHDLRRLLGEAETQLARQVDDWSLLLLRLDAEGRSVVKNRKV